MLIISSSSVNATNVAYVFHFYAASHSVGSFGNRITSAINSGNAVFISEWGTTSASGSGNPDDSATQQWISFMEQNKISNCNWSMRQYTSTLNNSNEESSILFPGYRSNDLNSIKHSFISFNLLYVSSILCFAISK